MAIIRHYSLRIDLPEVILAFLCPSFFKTFEFISSPLRDICPQHGRINATRGKVVSAGICIWTVDLARTFHYRWRRSGKENGAA